MNPAHKLWHQTIVCHGPENPGLAEQHHQNDRAEARDGTQLDY